jgi:hypothetical protein
MNDMKTMTCKQPSGVCDLIVFQALITAFIDRWLFFVLPHLHS